MRQIKFRFFMPNVRKMVYATPEDSYFREYFHHENVSVMQFTGLHDKTCKEIWEGDVVLINHPQDFTKDFTNSKQKVFWCDEEAAFYHGNGARPPKRMWEYCEVLGNIYENPELLSSNVS